MLQTLKNAWRTKDIRNKILFTMLIILLYRIGTVIPVPYVDAHDFAGSFSGTILDYLNLLSGGSLGQATLFALGVSPYINSSIIIQLLAVVFPKLGEISKNDKKKMGYITRVTTVILAVITALGYYFLLSNGGAFTNAATKGSKLYWFYGIVIVTCYVAGASLVMWLADRINEHGIGNGVSMILFANIVTALPQQAINMFYLIRDTFSYEKNSVLYIIIAILFALLLASIILAMTMFVIFITGSERRIPVQYAKRVVGRKMYGGQSTHIPIKVNMSGVLPVIFASSILSVVPTVQMLFFNDGETSEGLEKFFGIFATDHWAYAIMYFFLILFFAYFYASIQYNPVEMANNIRKNSGMVPGLRPGKPTADYIKKILGRITLLGALLLSVIALFPNVLTLFTKLIDSPMQLSLGGTSLIIVVGVALETVKQLESQMMMRHYKGFLD